MEKKELDKTNATLQAKNSKKATSQQERLRYAKDALKRATELKNKEDIATALITLGDCYLSAGEPEEAKKFFEKALSACQEIGDKVKESHALNNVGLAFRIMEDYEQAKKYLNRSLNIAEEIGYSPGISRATNNLGAIYYGCGQYEEALEYYQEALDIRKRINDNKGVAMSLNNLGNVHHLLGDFPRALDYYFQSLPYKKMAQDYASEAITLHNIGAVYRSMKEHKRALDYYNQAFTIRKKIRDLKGVADSLNNIGNIYLDLEQYERALGYFIKSQKLNQKLGSKKGVAIALNNIGLVYQECNKSGWALVNQLDALKVQEEIGDKGAATDCLANIGENYLKIGECEQAEYYFKKCLKMAEKLGLKTAALKSYQGMVDIYSLQGDYKIALEYHKKLAGVKEEILDEKKLRQIAELQIKYETKQKEKDIYLLEKEKQLQKKMLDQLNGLSEYGVFIPSSLNPHVVGEEFLEYLQFIVPCSKSFFMYQEKLIPGPGITRDECQKYQGLFLELTEEIRKTKEPITWNLEETKISSYFTVGEKDNFLRGFPVIYNEEILGYVFLEQKENSNSDGVINKLLGILMEQLGISLENVLLHKKVQRNSSRDDVTGLYSRRYFFLLGALEVVRAKEMQKDLSLLLLDIDDFKKINHVHGYQVGERILAMLARKCEKLLPQGSIIGRYRRDEFIMILPGKNVFQAKKTAKKIRENIASGPLRLKKLPGIKLTVSLGGVGLSIGCDSFPGLLRAAEKALRKAKAKGYNQEEILL